jgi:hypothetical protein
VVATTTDDVAVSYYAEFDPGGQIGLRFAWKSECEWQWTTVDPEGGPYSSLARGTDGTYHIASMKPSSVGWAYGSGTNWTLGPEVPTPTLTQPELTSLALDSANRPHVAFLVHTDAGESALHYTFWTGTAWAPIETIATGIWYPSIGDPSRYFALDSTNTPHIVFSGPGQEVKYAVRRNGAWQDADVGLGRAPVIAIAPGNKPHVLYNDNTIGFAHAEIGVDGEHWQAEPVAGGASAGDWALAIDSLGTLHAAYSSGPSEDLYIATRDVGGWSATLLDGDGSPSGALICGRLGLSVALDADGRAYVAYSVGSVYSGLQWRVDLRLAGPLFVPGDTNFNGSVDLRDFAILQDHFGESTVFGPSGADFNRDAIVDDLDFLTVVLNWIVPCP